MRFSDVRNYLWRGHLAWVARKSWRTNHHLGMWRYNRPPDAPLYWFHKQYKGRGETAEPYELSEDDLCADDWYVVELSPVAITGETWEEQWKKEREADVDGIQEAIERLASEKRAELRRRGKKVFLRPEEERINIFSNPKYAKK